MQMFKWSRWWGRSSGTPFLTHPGPGIGWLNIVFHTVLEQLPQQYFFLIWFIWSIPQWTVGVLIIIAIWGIQEAPVDHPRASQVFFFILNLHLFLVPLLFPKTDTFACLLNKLSWAIWFGSPLWSSFVTEFWYIRNLMSPSLSIRIVYNISLIFTVWFVWASTFMIATYKGSNNTDRRLAICGPFFIGMLFDVRNSFCFCSIPKSWITPKSYLTDILIYSLSLVNSQAWVRVTNSETCAELSWGRTFLFNFGYYNSFWALKA